MFIRRAFVCFLLEYIHFQMAGEASLTEFHHLKCIQLLKSMFVALKCLVGLKLQIIDFISVTCCWKQQLIHTEPLS